LPFQSGPDIELVVINVKSIILRGIYLLMILDCWQNYVKGWLETAQISPKGFHELNCLYKFLIKGYLFHNDSLTLSWSI